MSFFSSVYRKLPKFLKDPISLLWICKLPYWRCIQTKRKILIRKRGKAKVLFIASNLAMWRYEELFRELSKDSFFECGILLVPFKTFTLEEQKNSIRQLCDHFEKECLPFTDSSQEGFLMSDWLKTNDPDIIFYPQPYDSLFGNEIDSIRNFHRLLCLIPYSINTIDAEWIYNEEFHNVAWKLFYQTDLHKADAKRLASNHGRNVVVTGEPHIDQYNNPNHSDPWKKTKDFKKRIIWAPHFAIGDTVQLINRAGFDIIADEMLAMVKKYPDIQFAFKPHPKLKSTLYNFPTWGKQRTDSYYKAWSELSNGQLETADFIDLFYHSDALIHNCGSFTAEYMITGKPAMFIATDITEIENQLNPLGKEALHAHYLGSTMRDINDFIIKVVLEDDDPLKLQRNKVSKRFSAGADTTAKRIHRVLINELQ